MTNYKVMVWARIGGQQKDVLAQNARQRGVSLSEYVRQILIFHIEGNHVRNY